MNHWNDPDTVEKYISCRVSSEADRFVVHRLAELGPAKLVELGTGPGTVMKSAGFIQNYIPTDISLEFLSRLNCRLAVCASAASIPLGNSSLDCVLAMAVLHHLNTFELRDALREIHRILRPGGTFLLIEDWCFSRGDTAFEEEARKVRFRYGTKENHLAEGSWLLELETAGFRCRRRTWVRRPFHTADPRLMNWPEGERRVRMLFLEMERSL